MQNNSMRWKLRYKIPAVAVLASAGILGVGGAAQAAPMPLVAVAGVSAVSAQQVAGTRGVATATVPVSPAPPRSVDHAESRLGIKPLIDAAVKIIKGLPGWWSKFSSGAKKAFSWFNAYVWKPICAIANAVQVFVTGWDIWNWFH